MAAAVSRFTLLCLAASALCQGSASSPAYVAYDGRRLVKVTHELGHFYCDVWGHRSPVQEQLDEAKVQDSLLQVSPGELTALVDWCHSEGRSSPERNLLQGIYPGTKWCGPGDVAQNFEDLGKLVETDRCCRAHDSCAGSIPGGQTDTASGLTNTTPFTRSSCACDLAFLKCLSDDASKNSKRASCSVAQLFFNVGNIKCFKLDFPVVKCAKRGCFLNRKCLQYEQDSTKPQEWAFFDTPCFKSKDAACGN